MPASKNDANRSYKTLNIIARLLTSARAGDMTDVQKDMCNKLEGLHMSATAMYRAGGDKYEFPGRVQRSLDRAIEAVMAANAEPTVSPDLRLFEAADAAIDRAERMIEVANDPSFFKRHKAGIIVGGVVAAAVAGGGAYYFFGMKKKGATENASSDDQSTTTGE